MWKFFRKKPSEIRFFTKSVEFSAEMQDFSTRFSTGCGKMHIRRFMHTVCRRRNFQNRFASFFHFFAPFDAGLEHSSPREEDLTAESGIRHTECSGDGKCGEMPQQQPLPYRIGESDPESECRSFCAMPFSSGRCPYRNENPITGGRKPTFLSFAYGRGCTNASSKYKKGDFSS